MPAHVKDFSKKRNFLHFRLKGLVAAIDSIVDSEVTTTSEKLRLHSVRKTLTNYNKEFFSVSARRLAKEQVNGVD